MPPLDYSLIVKTYLAAGFPHFLNYLYPKSDVAARSEVTQYLTTLPVLGTLENQAYGITGDIEDLDSYEEFLMWNFEAGDESNLVANESLALATQYLALENHWMWDDPGSLYVNFDDEIDLESFEALDLEAKLIHRTAENIYNEIRSHFAPTFIEEALNNLHSVN